jgi:N-acetyl-1-D-myo-inositol-2-amino-2-deoxy-alpha-D-glucopyranoside deacetylase
MRLLVVVAHPDDESFGCGSLLAHATSLGWRTTVLCATRGEAGESRLATDDLAAVRERELRDAAAILGVDEVRLLDLVDSGMEGPIRPGMLCAADPASVAAQVATVLAEVQPDVLVTLDASDGHRDHRAIREAAVAAGASSTPPPRATYLWCLARSTMQRWAEHRRAAGGGDPYLEVPDLGTPDELITTVLDVREHLATRWDAIRAHRSQPSPYDDLPDELAEAFLGWDRLRLVQGEDVFGA